MDGRSKGQQLCKFDQLFDRLLLRIWQKDVIVKFEVGRIRLKRLLAKFDLNISWQNS